MYHPTFSKVPRLTRPGQPIAKNALTILINLSSDEEILNNLAGDDQFIETLLLKLTVGEPMN